MHAAAASAASVASHSRPQKASTNGVSAGSPHKAKEETAAPPNDSAPSTNDVVPGLTAWLTSLNLEDHITAAAEWAVEEGAVGLDEIVEFLDDLVEALQLTPVQTNRLKNQGAATASDFAAAAKGPKVTAPAPSDQCDEYEPEGEDAFCEARAGHLDVERDFCELSRFDQEAPSTTSQSAPKPMVKQTAAKAMAKPVVVSASAGAGEQQADSNTSAEKRIDPDTGRSITFEEMCKLYEGQYGPKEIQEYWETSKPAAKFSKTSRRY